jgi:hypothetical protein
MQIVVDLNERNATEVMEYLRKVADDVTVLSDEAVFLEPIGTDDPDFPFVEEARQARREGEKLYTLDEVIADLK